MLIGDTSKIELEFGCVGFRGEGKTGAPTEKPLGARTRTILKRLFPELATILSLSLNDALSHYISCIQHVKVIRRTKLILSVDER